MTTQFSWIPFYRELTQRLLTYEDKQGELIALLEAMRKDGLPVMFLSEDLPGGGRAPLTVMEPFTFMMNLNITTETNQLQMCRWLRDKLNLSAEAPADCDGLPTFVPIAPWFFWSADERKPEDIPRLWQLARAAWGASDSQIDSDLYRQCRNIKGVGLSKLTAGLYWFSPNGFLPLTGPVLPYLKAHGIEWNQKLLNQGDYEEYKSLIHKAHDVNFNHAELSHQAWQWKKNIIIVPPIAELKDEPLNTILYGPPGTGKTFNTINRAVEIIDGEAPEERDECMARFEELREAKQIGFVTFHQTFAYEEFIEGLRPVVDEATNGGARYAVRDGIFKEMALRALGNLLSGEHTGEPTFEAVWELFKHKIVTQPDWRLPGIDSAEYKITFSPRGTVIGENVKGNAQSPYNASPQNIEKVWDELPNEVKPSHNALMEILQKGSHTNLIGAIVQDLRKMVPQVTQETDEVEIARRFLKTGYKADLATAPSAPRFVLIVDEINRGNISKIFGELITLLEEDKRLGKTNALRVLLPYSGDTLALPPNLYLLGTMNTADKSLALLDVALRRRFTFKELNPDFSICKLPDSTMQKVLEELNRRIMLVLDREHRIGHAFFMDVTTAAGFNAVFADKIVPLLQEYFYNDWDGLRGVLGEKDAGSIVGTMASIEGVRGRNQYAWWHDLDKETPDFLTVLCKNYGIPNSATNAAQQDNAVAPAAEISANVSDPNASPDLE